MFGNVLVASSWFSQIEDIPVVNTLTLVISIVMVCKLKMTTTSSPIFSSHPNNSKNYNQEMLCYFKESSKMARDSSVSFFFAGSILL